MATRRDEGNFHAEYRRDSWERMEGGMKEEGTWWEEQRGKVPSCVGTGDGEES